MSGIFAMLNTPILKEKNNADAIAERLRRDAAKWHESPWLNSRFGYFRAVPTLSADSRGGCLFG